MRSGLRVCCFGLVWEGLCGGGGGGEGVSRSSFDVQICFEVPDNSAFGLKSENMFSYSVGCRTTRYLNINIMYSSGPLITQRFLSSSFLWFIFRILFRESQKGTT